jgi:trk system potassium uptake protein TrkH
MPGAEIAILALSVRPGVVLRYLGQLCLPIAGMTGVGLLVTAAHAEWGYAWRFAVLTALLVAAGGLALRRPRAARLQINEALVITVLVFLVGALALAWPLTASGLTPMDALFEGISAITTTGLSTQGSVAGFSFGFHFTRAWGQWFGGLGIVVLALAVLINPGPVARRLSPSDESPEDTASSTRASAARFTVIYLALTGAGVLVLLACGLGLYDAVLHALAAISTGGFSNYDASLAGLGGFMPQVGVTLIGLAGAVSFALYYRAWTHGWRTLVRDEEVRALLILGLVTTLLVAGMTGLSSGRWGLTALGQAGLVAFSAQTTTGFSPLDVGQLDTAAKAVLTFAMLIGGDMGSTAGGIKLVRFLILLKLLHAMIVRTCLPVHATIRIRVNGRRVDGHAVHFAGVTTLWFVVVTLLAWLPFLVLGYAPLDALFEVASAIGTVGLSTGIAAGLESGWLKGLLALVMLMGRLEIIAILVFFYPRTWIGRRALSR